MTTPSQPLLTIKPKHWEIMDRLLCGSTQRDIAVDLGMSESRLSIIVNSPIFQLELRKRRMRREALALDIQEEILEGGKEGVHYHRQLLNDQLKGVTAAPELKQKSATVLATLGARVITPTSPRNGNGGVDEGVSKSYEERLKEITKEVTMKETVRTIETQKVEEESEGDPDITKLLEGDYPPDEEEESPFEENQPELESDPLPQLDDLIGKLGGEKGGTA